jgi:DNA-binding CsgD family transcriptional regulator
MQGKHCYCKENAEGERMDWHADAFEKVTIRSVDDVRPAAVAIQDIAAKFELRIAATPDIASKAQMVDAKGAIINADIFGWTADGERWWEDGRLALTSPIPRACRYESEPFWCNANGAVTVSRNKYLEDLNFADFPQFSSATAIIVIPAHLSFGQIAAASFTPFDRLRDDLSALFARHSDFLGAVTRRFLASYVNTMRTQQWIPSDCRLSKREVECLRWAAIGKTDKEISLILSLSHATVRYHVQRAGEKLNAVNRSQAVFKAGQLGYLGAAA